MNLFRRLVIIADLVVIGAVALTIFGMTRSHNYVAPISDDNLFLVLFLLVIANLICLIGVPETRPRRMVGLWLDAKEKELRRRSQD